MDLVFSDIHADIDGLQAILDVAFSPDFEAKYGKISRIVSLGDLLERGTGPKQVLRKMTELSRSYPMISVMGNHDEGFLYKRDIGGSSYASQTAHNSLTQQDLEFFTENGDGTFGNQITVEKGQATLRPWRSAGSGYNSRWCRGSLAVPKNLAETV
jgi:predicted MPP superfamily phosphohydrolase